MPESPISVFPATAASMPSITGPPAPSPIPTQATAHPLSPAKSSFPRSSRSSMPWVPRSSRSTTAAILTAVAAANPPKLQPGSPMPTAFPPTRKPSAKIPKATIGRPSVSGPACGLPLRYPPTMAITSCASPIPRPSAFSCGPSATNPGATDSTTRAAPSAPTPITRASMARARRPSPTCTPVPCPVQKSGDATDTTPRSAPPLMARLWCNTSRP